MYRDFAVSFEKLTEAIGEELKAENYSRIVIDPITMLKLTIKDELEYRRTFMAFLKVVSSSTPRLCSPRRCPTVILRSTS
ncbi:hypothetical protein [Thermococcus peptonophilus]